MQEIVDLAGAIEFLEEWPEDRRSLIHETALRACCQAHDGRKPMGLARNAFVASRSEPESWKTPRQSCRGSLLPIRAVDRCRCRLVRWSPLLPPRAPRMPICPVAFIGHGQRLEAAADQPVPVAADRAGERRACKQRKTARLRGVKVAAMRADRSVNL
ncbi:DUF982 domain-containing protein [Mesorhizobium temperatum]|uniref:DUF982 domain-containing protein n=1 Tax=Mesorhizobium temperatum TaxID=241416 RepID=UPI003CC93BCC